MEKRQRFVSDGDEINVASTLDRDQDDLVFNDDAASDDKALGALGYKQEFKRDFTLWESFSVSFSVLGLLPSVASTLGFNLGYSGSAGMIWGWLISAVLIQPTAFSMAELCSSMPTAGGLYYASAVLAPEGWGPMASWFVGWSNFCAFLTAPCSFNYALASMLVTCGEITYPNYEPKTWHIYLVLLALLITQGLISMQRTKFVGRFNALGTLINLGLILIFIIWFPVGASKFNDNKGVWTTFTNGTEWPIGWSVIMGFLATLWTLGGYDAPFHISEETSNANIAAPRAIIMTAQLGLYLGFAIVILIGYTVQNVPDVVSGKYGQPFGSLCLQVLGKNAGLGLFAINIVAQYFGAQACVVTATRISFAYARDGALPASRIWATVDRRTKTPVYTTWGVILVAALLGLLMFGGPVTINAVFGIGTIGQYTSFTIPIIVKLFNPKRFRPGPWTLGRWSTATNVIAVLWWLLIMPALCFPVAKGSDLTLQLMNWTSLIYGGAMALAMAWYAIDARKWFKGPRINLDHIDAPRIEGKEPKPALEVS